MTRTQRPSAKHVAASSVFVFLVASVIGFAAGSPTERVSPSIIQVAVVRQAARLTLRAEGKFSVVDQKTGETYVLEPSKDYLLEGTGQHGVLLGDYRFDGQLRLTSRNPQDTIRVGQRKYRGSFVVKPKAGGTFTVVNEVGIEDYLYGVVPAEMSPGWPEEALKAQAVVARTFALANLGKFRAEGFDFSDDTASQSYADLNGESAAATRAVQETEGQVLTWQGKVLKAYFHSCCGGHTCNLGVVWGPMEKVPKPLRGVSDRYCRISPHEEWTAYFAATDIAGALQKHGFPISKVKAIRLGRRDNASGFVKTLMVRGDRKWLELRAVDLRKWLGASELKSTKIYRIVPNRHGWTFLGKGYGHGVGLCQWGAKAMAERGKNYRAILNFYFPGAKLETFND